MKLTQIDIRAFKSLVDVTLPVVNPCVGMVGINESGKSNILSAIQCLSKDYALGEQHIPRMAKNKIPEVLFEFVITEKEKNKFLQELNKILSKSSLLDNIIEDISNRIVYIVKFDSTEKRYIRLNEIKAKKGFVLLKNEFVSDEFKFFTKSGLLKAAKMLVLSENDLKEHSEFLDKCSQLIKIEKKLNELSSSKDGVTQESEEYKNATKEIEDLSSEITSLKKIIGEYNPVLIEQKLQDEVKNLKNTIEVKNKELDNILKVLPALEKSKAGGAVPHVNAYNAKIQTRDSVISTIEKNKERIEKIESELKVFHEPADSMFTNDFSVLNKYWLTEVDAYFETIKPKIVYWEKSDDYTLESSTNLDDLINAGDLGNISRPLVNIFRICANIRNFKELVTLIETIKTDDNERAKLNKSFNRALRQYLKDVWEDYDQEIQVTLEESKIILQFYDPAFEDASYYSMRERSQGCQSYISFLLTVGAEAKNGVISDTILLLDEPETHLHPSGVKFMLKELIKISNKNNQVIYATHSIFMIDRENYDRHVIISKHKERTHIQPSIKDRVGYFMQEEVLYGALDTRINQEFDSTEQFNFVFEGDGDVMLFEHCYSKVLKQEDRPFILKSSKFFHGGGCNNIGNYFKSSPIQLGSKWIIILDSDTPANKLKTMLEGKYKEHIGTHIFIYQYFVEDLDEVELEDLLPKELLLEVFMNTINRLGYQIDEDAVSKIIDQSFGFTAAIDAVKSQVSNESDDIFKEAFKEILNTTINSKALECKKLDDLEKKFPAYTKWLQTVLRDLKSKT